MRNKTITTADSETLAPDADLGYRIRPSAQGLFGREAINGGDRIQWNENSDGLTALRGEPVAPCVAAKLGAP